MAQDRRTDERTDRQANGQTDGHGQNNIPPPLAGDKKQRQDDISAVFDQTLKKILK